MQIPSHLKKLIKGLTIPQEYRCLAVEGFPDPLRTYLTLGNFTVNRDVTHAHLFLGYKPLVIGIPIAMECEVFRILQQNEEVVLHFMQLPATSDPGRHEFQTERSVAKLILRQREVVVLDEYALFVYEGVAGEHSFLNRGHQLVNTVLQKLRPVQAANINLEGNHWNQVRIAYSISRQISIITVSDGTLINIFPTVLNSTVGKIAECWGIFISITRSGELIMVWRHNCI